MVYNALYKALRKLTKKAKPGDVYPSVLKLLRCLVPNDVGEYNLYDALKHLLKEDSLDKLLFRILLKRTTVQATLLTPFEGIDVDAMSIRFRVLFSNLRPFGHLLVFTTYVILNMVFYGIQLFGVMSFISFYKCGYDDYLKNPFYSYECAQTIIARICNLYNGNTQLTTCAKMWDTLDYSSLSNIVPIYSSLTSIKLTS
ncbi:hypothetical protein PsorP6_015614 [Peronosclerospora sorghi]|uniref:Uncharacterized protein n=1 Tax=Peronosclerospora sorghi TaxID=230839 RepID=A0ACC0WMK2_9STRA|nr:hypothetical protein PsorP6_015614 [Peronosclerospora sorghi]